MNYFYDYYYYDYYDYYDYYYYYYYFSSSPIDLFVLRCVHDFLKIFKIV